MNRSENQIGVEKWSSKGCYIVIVYELRRSVGGIVTKRPRSSDNGRHHAGHEWPRIMPALVRETGLRYPIIVDSAWELTEQWVRDSAHRGLNVSFLSVPCDIEAILAAVETALKIRRLPVENPRIRRCQI